MTSRSTRIGACLTAIALALSTNAGAQTAYSAGTRIIVKSQDDLPRHIYPVQGTATALLNADDATFNAFAAPIAADVDATLSRYDIRDHAALRDLLSTRLAYQMISHRDREALATVMQIRALEDKPDARLMSGVRSEAILKARLSTGASSGPAYEKIYAANYAAALGAMPWSVTGNEIKEVKQKAEIVTPALIEGFIKRNVEPAVSHDHRVGDKFASDILWARMVRNAELPLAAQSVTVLSAVVARNNIMKPDIWAARDVTFGPGDKLTPVVAAVWDSGTDLSLFPGRVYTDPHPSAALPYNEHGLAYDIEDKPQAGWLRSLTPEQQRQYPTLVADLQGLNDLQQSINSPAAAALKAKFKAMPSDAVPAYFERLNYFSGYLHGTHVAGILARGNPAIRLAVSRITFDDRNVPAPPTDALMQRQAEMYRASVAWFKRHGVRVVNMSWGGDPSGYEHDLEVNGIGKDAAERKKLARHYFEMDRDALYAALKSAPEVLFVCAGGNENADSSFGEFIPASFELPNLLTVSAVDRGGDEASFTSYGKTVVVSANGYQVESVIPGGGHLLDSGTSMASPNAANLAAKLIALDPTLTPEKTIALIRAGATASADGRRHNINPKASMALLRKR